MTQTSQRRTRHPTRPPAPRPLGRTPPGTRRTVHGHSGNPPEFQLWWIDLRKSDQGESDYPKIAFLHGTEGLPRRALDRTSTPRTATRTRDSNRHLSACIAGFLCCRSSEVKLGTLA